MWVVRSTPPLGLGGVHHGGLGSLADILQPRMQGAGREDSESVYLPMSTQHSHGAPERGLVSGASS